MQFSDLPGAGEAAASAALTGLGFSAPVAAAMAWGTGSIIGQWLSSRRQIAIEELQRQMAKGRPWLIADDKTAAIVLQYARAYQEGVARDNLRLMAEFMFAEAADPTLGEAELRRNLGLLASLGHEEIIVCARMVRVLHDMPNWNWQPGGKHHMIEQKDRLALFNRHVTTFFLATASTSLNGKREYAQAVRRKDDMRKMHGVMSALLRTGWFVAMREVYTPTVAFHPVARMVEFEAQAEG